MAYAQNLLERLIAALEAAGDDETVGGAGASKLEQIALGLRGAAYQVAIGALSGAGGQNAERLTSPPNCVRGAPPCLVVSPARGNSV